MSRYFDEKDLFMGPQVNQYGSHMIMTDVIIIRFNNYSFY